MQVSTPGQDPRVTKMPAPLAAPDEQILLLVQACASLLSEPDTEGVVVNIIRIAQRFVSADAYALWRRAPSGDAWKVVSSSGLSQEYGHEAKESTVNGPLPTHIMAFDDVFATDYLSPRWAEYRAEGIKSMLTIPLRVDGGVTGTLVFYYRTRHPFTESDKTLAAALGDLAAGALKTADLYSEQRRLRAAAEQAATRGAFLAEAGSILASSLEIEQTLFSIADLAVPTIADWCAVDLLESEGKARRVAVQHVDRGKIPLAHELHRRFPPAPGSQFWRSIETGESAYSTDIQKAHAKRPVEPEKQDLIDHLGIRSFIYAPLAVRGEVLGLLTLVMAESGRQFTAGDVEFVEQIAQRAAFAVHSARLHRAVSQSASRLRLAAGAAELGIFEWDVEKDQAFWENSRMYEIFRRAPKAGPMSREQFFRDLLHAEDAGPVDKALAEAMFPGGHLQLVCRIVRPPGEIRWLEFAGVFEQSHPDRSLRLAAVVADITERREAEEQLRESEERLRFALQSGQLGRWELDLATGKAVGSLEHFEIFGYREIIPNWTYDTFLQQVIAEDKDIVERRLRQAGNLGEDIDLEIRIRRLDGETRWIWIRARCLQTPGGCSRLIGLVSDVTDRKRIEERLRETAKLESIGVLAGGVAHDFNNLLTGILGNASLALEILEESHPVRELLQDVTKASERAAGLTNQLLAYSGRGHFVLEQVDLSALVVETATLLGKLISPAVRLDLSLAPNLFAIDADRAQIQQVVMNLILNAAEALGESAGTVAITTTGCDLDPVFLRTLNPAFEIKPGRYVRLTIADDGCGMDEATIAKIFDPFFTTKFTGRGLGLSAVLGTVRGHKGSLKVLSEPGRGTTFEVYFPKRQGGAVHRAPAQSKRIAAHAEGTILIVDDEEIVRTTVRAMLEHWGYRVLMAVNGQEAVGIFGNNPAAIDWILLDLSMPLMNGQQTLPLLRQIRPDVRVILSTGYSEAEAVQRFAGLGLAGVLQKPYTSTALREILISTPG